MIDNRLCAERDVAREIGQQVIDAADSIRKYCPDCQAVVQFEIDGMDIAGYVQAYRLNEK